MLLIFCWNWELIIILGKLFFSGQANGKLAYKFLLLCYMYM